MKRIFLATVLLVLFARSGNSAEPLRVCATVPDLGQLSEVIGGDDVTVTVSIE